VRTAAREGRADARQEEARVKDDIDPEVVAILLDDLRQRFEAGDRNALIQAIRRCFQCGVVAPEWVVTAFFRATNKWYQMDAKSLDDALGVAWPKGKSVAAAKKRRRLKFAVFNEINKARARGRAVDEELYQEIGRQFGIGKTLVKVYDHAARTQMGTSPRKRRRKS
jgi:hypothetical protein